MPPSALWLFAHHALAPQFHEDPQRFMTTLDGNAAPRFLEQLWQWALTTASRDPLPANSAAGGRRPPLSYDLQQLANGSLVRMQFRNVRLTGEPWSIRFAVKDQADARMFLLEHSEYASELAGKPQAIICESCQGGRHQNWGATLAPDDEDGFEAFVFDKLRAQA